MHDHAMAALNPVETAWDMLVHGLRVDGPIIQGAPGADIAKVRMGRRRVFILGHPDQIDHVLYRTPTGTTRASSTSCCVAHGHRVVAHMLATRPRELVEHLLADDGFLVRSGSEFIAAHLEHGDREHPHPDPQRTGEILARLFVALVLMPPPSVDLGDPALARDLVVPLVRERAPGDEGQTRWDPGPGRSKRLHQSLTVPPVRQ